MTDVELLPLPEPLLVRGDIGGLYTGRECQHYARANLAPLQAENERLRAEVEDYRTNGAAAVRFAPNSAHWSKELRRLFGDDARAGIEVLENWHLQELARAERLAEALMEYGLPLTGDDIQDAWEFGDEAVAREKRRRAALAQEDRNG